LLKWLGWGRGGGRVSFSRARWKFFMGLRRMGQMGYLASGIAVTVVKELCRSDLHVI
jgi:hypothetical protein